MNRILRKVLDYDEMSAIVALHVKRFIRRSNSNIGLPTGSTPLGMYEELKKDFRLKWDNVKTYNLDEYVGIDTDHPQSYKTYMDNNLFNHVDIPKENIHFPKDETYDNLITKNGGLDFLVLGIGNNGHIAFNEPGSSFDSTTRKVKLDERTISDNSRFFNSVEEVPTEAYTMGLKTIMDSREIYLIAQGKSKWDIIREAFYGEITQKVPASILQKHQNITVLYCD
tara:strand:+ start:24 stop:698 length:675 start_codon:yes stop_codon:yes gene_type:complete